MRGRLLFTIAGACLLLRLIFAAGGEAQYQSSLCLEVQEEVEKAVSEGLLSPYDATAIVNRCFLGAQINE